MTFYKEHRDLAEAFLCSFALMIFSFFIHFEFPLKLVSLSSLVLAAYLLGRRYQTLPDLINKTGLSATFTVSVLLSLAGIVAGTILAILCRWHLGISLLPGSIHSFVIVAALIGATEELVFRGFLQEMAVNINGPFSVFFSTISHTGYKCCLFLSPASSSGIDIPDLALWTFLFGLLFGTIKHLSKSLLPSLIAHVLFDILVYAEFVKAPWWVW
jgi:membrane protease YdiL (CAAX protease family)